MPQEIADPRARHSYAKFALPMDLPAIARRLRQRRVARGRGGVRLEALEARVLLSAATINWATQEQTIAGFGASSAWILGSVDSSQQQLLWSTTNGAGMSLLRSHINPDTSSSSGEINTMKSAQAMGVTVWSTPWSPPAAWKSNNDVANGGSLLASHYQDYANWLKQYVINMAGNGITIYAVSMQNEPDWTATYESCLWTSQQFHDALSILHDTLAADSRTANVMIILPEETHWDSLNLASLVMSDSVESNYANLIYADHTYGDYSTNNPISGLNGHQIWETEHTGTDPSVGIQAGLDEASSIYHVVGQNQASAFHHWWINSSGGAGMLDGNWDSTKVFSAMENYAKFIRPGWVQVGESNDANGLLISAYKNPATGDFATVLVNNGTSAITETINLNGAYCPVLTPWVTSATLDMDQQQSIPATGNGAAYSYTIPAKSVVTLTGNATITPVTEVPVGLLATAATTTTVTLSWTNNLPSATGYTVQRSANGTSWTTVTSALSSATYAYTDSGLSANTLYYYRVQANNGTLASNAVAQMTQAPAPTNLTASYSTSTLNVTLNWTRNNSSVTDYAVDVSTDGGVTWTTKTSGLSNTTSSYTDTSAPELATLQYRVRAVYGFNSSAPTNVASVTTTVLKAPTSLAVAQTGSTLVLTWTDATATNATVSIERSTDGTNWTVVTSVNHGVQTYTDATVTEGGTYYYRIRNYYSSTYSAYTAISQVTVAPAAPAHVEVEFSPLPALTARVLWVDNAISETAYEVDRSADGGSTWTTLTTTLPPAATTYTDTTVSGGQVYEYRVKALHNTIASAAVATLSETANALPSPFAHGDIGDAGTLGLAGSSTYNSSNSTYTLTGSGTDIWNTADGFQYGFTTLTGDGQMTVRVASLTATNAWAKAGLMIRAGLAVDAPFANVVVTPGNGVGLQWRTTAGGTCGNAQTAAITAPVWLRLTRAGNVFRAYYSSDNSTYTQIGTGTTITMGSTAYAGMISCAHDSTLLATANFASFALTGTGNQAPTVAAAAAANPSPATGSTSTLTVTGADDAGAGNLIYNWTTSGSPPAPVVFSTNGQNGSKNTLATFSKAGTYSFVVTITDQFDLATTSSVSLTVNQVLTTSGIFPASSTIAPGGTVQFNAGFTDQFGDPITSQGNATWSVYSGSGTINASGLYTAPGSEVGLVTVRAVTSFGQVFYANANVLSQVAWYRADETGGSTLADSSGNGKNATLAISGTFGSYGFAGGVSGNAVTFTGSGSNGGYASLPSGIVSALTDFTIACWIKPTTVDTSARIFDFGNGTSSYMFFSSKSSTTSLPRYAIKAPGGTEQQITSSTAIIAGAWQHVAIVYAGGVGSMYINGTLVGSTAAMTYTPAMLGTSTNNLIGYSQFTGNPKFNGAFDDFRIIGRALSLAELQALIKPTIVTAATASAVTSTSASLFALGADRTVGESNLTYTWTVTGTPPAPVSFSANTSNAAKTTTATFTKPGTYNFLVTVANPLNYTVTSSLSLTITSTMLARQLFYGGSVFDGASHDNAIADKVALLPGGAAGFANYSSYSRGLNGVLLDILNPAGTLSASDFVFRIGNGNAPSGWALAPAPLTVVNGAGPGGATRVAITWADNAIQNTWLQVTLDGGAGSTSALAADDVFYFGNAIADTGNDPASARVDVIDELAARGNSTASANIANPFDFNRDGLVDATDQSIARAHMTWWGNQLQFIGTPPMGAGIALAPLDVSPDSGADPLVDSAQALTAFAAPSTATESASAAPSSSMPLPQADTLAANVSSPGDNRALTVLLDAIAAAIAEKNRRFASSAGINDGASAATASATTTTPSMALLLTRPAVSNAGQSAITPPPAPILLAIVTPAAPSTNQHASTLRIFTPTPGDSSPVHTIVPAPSPALFARFARSSSQTPSLHLPPVGLESALLAPL